MAAFKLNLNSYIMLLIVTMVNWYGFTRKVVILHVQYCNVCPNDQKVYLTLLKYTNTLGVIYKDYVTKNDFTHNVVHSKAVVFYFTRKTIALRVNK